MGKGSRDFLRPFFSASTPRPTLFKGILSASSPWGLRGGPRIRDGPASDDRPPSRCGPQAPGLLSSFFFFYGAGASSATPQQVEGGAAAILHTLRVRPCLEGGPTRGTSRFLFFFLPSPFLFPPSNGGPSVVRQIRFVEVKSKKKNENGSLQNSEPAPRGGQWTTRSDPATTNCVAGRQRLAGWLGGGRGRLVLNGDWTSRLGQLDHPADSIGRSSTFGVCVCACDNKPSPSTSDNINPVKKPSKADQVAVFYWTMRATRLCVCVCVCVCVCGTQLGSRKPDHGRQCRGGRWKQNKKETECVREL